MLVHDLIADALTVIGEISRQQSLSPEDLSKGLRITNALLDSWSTERLMLFGVVKLQCRLIPNQQDYTIGPSGATFTNQRPVIIQSAQIILGTNT